MLSREENELLTRSDPGTPLGELMRRYWVPAALSRELPEPDCPPVRVNLLGEKLVVFRDTDGRLGLLDEFCAHRRASLFFGRNEEGGLRCIYHGWKYDIQGNCVDMPSERPESQFKQKIHLKSYPTLEIGGLVWTYMGPKEKMPPPPKFRWTQVGESYRYVSKNWQECNWLQALEGGIDNVHAAFLHRKLKDESPRPGISPKYHTVRNPAAKIDLDLTDYGLVYASLNDAGEDEVYVGAAHFVMPFHQVRAYPIRREGRSIGTIMRGHIWVPMDDENCMAYHWMANDGASLTPEAIREMEWSSGRGEGEILSNFRKYRNKDNDWMIDRAVQKTETYSGIEGTNTQDEAVQTGMGPIVDRSQEHLGTTDKVIIAARRLLLQAIRYIQQGETPPGINATYYDLKGINQVLPKDADWREWLRGA